MKAIPSKNITVTLISNYKIKFNLNSNQKQLKSIQKHRSYFISNHKIKVNPNSTPKTTPLPSFLTIKSELVQILLQKSIYPYYLQQKTPKNPQNSRQNQLTHFLAPSSTSFSSSCPFLSAPSTSWDSRSCPPNWPLSVFENQQLK